jgi:lipopolysaccharide assembly outer membrane protein LptD (OstA)
MLTPMLHARGDAIGVDYAGGSAAAINDYVTLNGGSADMRSSYFRGMATAGLEARWPILFGGFIILIVFFMRGGIIQGVSLLFSALARLVPRRA